MGSEWVVGSGWWVVGWVLSNCTSYCTVHTSELGGSSIRMSKPKNGQEEEENPKEDLESQFESILDLNLNLSYI